MKSTEERKNAIILFCLVIGFALIYFLKNNTDIQTIKVGIFSGSYWNVPGSSYEELLDSAKEKFQKEYPNIHIEYVEGITAENYSEWLNGKVMLGETPDIFLLGEGDFWRLSSIGVLKNLDQYMESDQSFYSEDYYSAAMKSGQNHGKQYALPFACNTSMMFVNKSLLRKNGLAVPKADWDWTTLERLCRKLTKDTTGDGILDQFGIIDYGIEDSIVANDCRLFSDDGKKVDLLNTKAIESIEILKRLYDLYKGYDVGETDFDMGKVAFRPMTLTEYRTYLPYPWRVKKDYDFEWTAIPMPKGNYGGNASMLNSLLLAMSSQTSNDKIAWEFMKTLTNDEEVQSMLYEYAAAASPMKSVNKSIKTHRLLIQNTAKHFSVDANLLDDTLERSVTLPKFEDYSELLKKLDYELEQYIHSESNSDTKLYEINKELQNYLDRK